MEIGKSLINLIGRLKIKVGKTDINQNIKNIKRGDRVKIQSYRMHLNTSCYQFKTDIHVLYTPHSNHKVKIYN